MANVTVNIAAGADDGDERRDDANFNSAGNAMRPTSNSPSSNAATAFMRFAIPTIATGDTIDSATITFKTLFSIDDTRLDMSCEDVDDAANLTTTADIINRVKTTAVTLWDAVGVGVTPTSPSFASSVQEVIDRAGWSSGNNLGCIWDGQITAPARDIIINSYEASDTIPQISVDYTVGSGGNAMPMAMQHYRMRRAG